MVALGDLFLSFLKIGLFTFGGGYAMILLIEREVSDRKRWVAKGEFADLLTVAQSAPGPISLNTAVFVGYKMRGALGAFASIAGVVLPSFAIILVVAMFFAGIRDNAVVAAAFKGMRPAVVALIVVPVISLARGMNGWLVGVTLISAFVIWWFRFSPIYLIIAAAAIGMAWCVWIGKEARR